MRLGEMIKEYREARGMSQRAFARKCGLSNGQIAFLERGIGNSGKPFEPTFDTLRKVARAMGTYPEYLMETADEFKISLRRRDTTDDDLGILLFGDAPYTQDQLEEVKRYANWVIERDSK